MELEVNQWSVGLEFGDVIQIMIKHVEGAVELSEFIYLYI
jgi:hypothetical protein